MEWLHLSDTADVTRKSGMNRALLRLSLERSMAYVRCFFVRWKSKRIFTPHSRDIGCLAFMSVHSDSPVDPQLAGTWGVPLLRMGVRRL